MNYCCAFVLANSQKHFVLDERTIALFKPLVCVCVCVCVWERERERES